MEREACGRLGGLGALEAGGLKLRAWSSEAWLRVGFGIESWSLKIATWGLGRGGLEASGLR